MSIKFIDKLEPGGNFKLVEAEHIKYKHPSDRPNITDVATALQNLEDTVFAKPCGYVHRSENNKIYDLGEDITLNLYLHTPSIGDCTVTVTQKATGSTAGFSGAKSYKVSPGDVTLTLGHAQKIQGITYRITAIDGQNKSFEFCYYESSDTQLSPPMCFKNCDEKNRYLDSSIISGLVSFKSGFDSVAASQIFLTGQSTTISFTGEHVYAKESTSKVIKFKLKDAQNNYLNWGSAAEEQTDEQVFEIQSESQVAGTTTRFTVAPTLPILPTAGVYRLEMILTVNYRDTDGSIKEDTDARIEQAYNLEAMLPNSVTLVDSTNIPAAGYTSNDYISLSIMPKASNTNDQGARQIKVVGSLYFVGTNDPNYNKITESQPKYIGNFERFVTHGELFTWNIGNLFDQEFFNFLQEKYTAEEINEKNKIYCKAQLTASTESSEMQEALTINFMFANLEQASKQFVADNLEVYFDFSDSSTFENTDDFIGFTNKVDPATTQSEIKLKLQAANAPACLKALSNSVTINNSDYLEAFNGLSLSGTDFAYTVAKETKDNAISYSRLNLWYDITGVAGASGNFTLETRLRGSSSGNLDALLLSLGLDPDNKGTGSMQIKPNTVSIARAQDSCKNDLRENIWHHICLVAAEKLSEDRFNFNPTKTLRIYIDGILSKVCTYDSSGSGLGSVANWPLTVNGSFTSTATDTLAGQAKVDLQFIRCYSQALTPADVYKNYLSSLGSDDLRAVIEARNTPAATPYICFVTNLAHTAAQTAFWNKKSLATTSFNSLHRITVKKDSKKYLVNCTMYWFENNEVHAETDVDVYLQGTSSLNYPVKNYQIKIYETVDGVRQSKKISIPYLTPDERLKLTTDASVYTLKCDFMEQSHRNNTPTACYYEDFVLPQVMEYCSEKLEAAKRPELLQDASAKYSPPKRVFNQVLHNGDTVSVNCYRDAIFGKPCTVYYIENTTAANIGKDGFQMPTGKDLDAALSSYLNYAGTYMFNVDKEGEQLGFELATKDATKISFDSIEVSSTDPKIYVDATGLFIHENQAANGYELNTSETENTKAFTVYPCTSYEGATNDNYSAAAFVPFGLQKELLLRNIYDTAETHTQELTETGADGEPIKTTIQVKRIYYRAIDIANNKYALNDDEEFTKDENVYDDFATVDDFLAAVEAKESLSTDYVESADKKDRLFFEVFNAAEHVDYYGDNEWEYYEKTLDPRHTWAADFAEDSINTEEISQQALANLGWSAIPDKTTAAADFKSYQEEYTKLYDSAYAELYYPAAFSTMQKAINWIYNSVQAIEQATSEAEKNTATTTFRSDFKKYFSFEYCLAYYLQMLAFTQVDNAGKNAMFDTWGDGRLYPRPYDMDTQMGLDNTGFDVKPIGAELHADLSPMEKSSNSISVSNWAATADPLHARFTAYNTNKSLLWKSFGTYFEEEIKACYAYLRSANKAYSAEKIANYVNNKTSDVLGETFYNDDAYLKYLHSPEYYYCINGARVDRYCNFIEKRLVFLDTLFDHKSSINGDILLRANAISATSHLGILPYSPQYIKLRVDSGDSIMAYVDEETKYIEADGITRKDGARFKFSTGGQDKNIYISGAGNIQHITGLESLKLTTLNLANAQKLSNVQVSGSSLTSLTFGRNEYLVDLDLSNISGLTISLDLHECVNLKTLDISNSGITNLVLPANGQLAKLNCKNSQIQTLELNGLTELNSDNLNLTGCSELRELTIRDCPKLESFALTSFKKLTTFRLSGTCPLFTSVNLSSLKQLDAIELNTEYVTSLNCKDCTGAAFNQLNLRYLTKLTNLNLQSVQAANAASGGTVILAQLPNDDSGAPQKFRLTDLKLHGSNISTLYTVAKNAEAIPAPSKTGFDFSHISVSGILTLRSNTVVSEIHNLHYTGDLRTDCTTHQGFLSNCTNLKKVEGCLIGTNTTSCAYMFWQDSKLESLLNTSFTFPNVKTASGVFHQCSKIDLVAMCKILLALNKSETSEGLSLEYFADATKISGELPASITETVENVTYVYPTIPYRTENLNDAFASNTGISGIAPGFLDAGTGDNQTRRLSTVCRTFSGCTSLSYVPDNLFWQCYNLTQVRSAFHGCTSLGSESSLSKQVIIASNKLSITQKTDDAGKTYYEFLDNATGDNINIADTVEHICIDATANSTDIEAAKSYTKINDKWYLDEKYRPPIIFTYNNIVFPKNSTSLVEVNGLFYNCTALTRYEDTSAKLKDFFDSLPNLKNCTGVFYNCNKLDFVFDSTDGASGIFESCKDTIAEINYLFAKSGLSTIPSNLLHVSSDNGLPSLTGAKSLFAGCQQLTNLVHIGSKFFSQATNLKYIGKSANYADPNSTVGWDSNPNEFGMFANTKVSIDSAAFSKLTNLVDMSGCFYSNNAEYFPTLRPAVGSSLTLFSTEAEKNTSLRDVSYLFAGNKMVGIVADEFLAKAPNIVNMSYIFKDCTLQVNTVPKMFQRKSALTNVNYAFTNNKSVSFTFSDKAEDAIFLDCRSLQSCKGMFAFTEVKGEIPASLFNDCRSTIQNISYMFASCTKLTHIATGSAIINDSTCVTVYDNVEVKFNNLTEPELEGLRDNHWFANPEAPTIAEFKAGLLNNVDGAQSILSNWFGEAQPFDRYKNYLSIEYDKKINEILSTYGIEELPSNARIQVQFGTNYSYYSTKSDFLEALYIETSKRDNLKYDFTFNLIVPADNPTGQLINEAISLGSKLKFYYNNKHVQIVQPGLLSDCIALTRVKGLFDSCIALRGAIPADLFYFSADKSANSSLTDLSKLFNACANLTCAKYCSVSTTEGEGGEIIKSYAFTPPGPTFTSKYSSCVKVYDLVLGQDNKISQNNVATVMLSRGGNYLETYPCLVEAIRASNEPLEVYQSETTTAEPEWFLPEDWFNGLTYAKNISDIFNNVGTCRFPDTGSHFSLASSYTGTLSNSGCLELLKLPNNLFQSQYLIETAAGAFKNCLSIGGTELTSTFLSTSLARLTNISQIFYKSRLFDIKENVFTYSGRNDALAVTTYAFYRLNEISSTVNLYVKSSGDAAVASDLASAYSLEAPKFWTEIFSAIDTSRTLSTFSKADYWTFGSSSYDGSKPTDTFMSSIGGDAAALNGDIAFVSLSTVENA